MGRRPPGFKALAFATAMQCAAGGAFGDGALPCCTAKAVVTSTNGVRRTLPLAAEAQPDGGRRFTVRAADAQGAKWVDVFADCARAAKGEDGYWISQRGLLGRFTRDSGKWAVLRDWVTLPYFGMKTPRHDELVDGFVRVRYGNGEAIYVNHTDKPQTAEGVTVPAMDFRLISQVAQKEQKP